MFLKIEPFSLFFFFGLSSFFTFDFGGIGLVVLSLEMKLQNVC